jgi:hypothetical protein
MRVGPCMRGSRCLRNHCCWKDWTTTTTTLRKIQEIQRDIEDFQCTSAGKSELLGKSREQLYKLAVQVFEDVGLPPNHMLTIAEVPVRS